MCAKTVEECPITYISFRATGQVNNNNYPDSVYDKLAYSSTITLLTSKVFDALPVTSFVLESQPCMVNKVSVSNAHYLLEKNQHTACPRDSVTGLHYDPRFYQTDGL